MFFITYPVEPTGCGAAHSKYCRKREHQWGDVVVYGQAVHTEHIFITFSRETSISVALASHTRDACLETMSN